MSDLYPALILKGLDRLLMARFTPHSRADVALKFCEGERVNPTLPTWRKPQEIPVRRPLPVLRAAPCSLLV